MITKFTKVSGITRLLLFSVILLIIMFCLSSVQTASSEGKPVLLIPSPHYDAGTFWEGETIVHTFNVRNDGDAELRILRVKPG